MNSKESNTQIIIYLIRALTYIVQMNCQHIISYHIYLSSSPVLYPRVHRRGSRWISSRWLIHQYRREKTKMKTRKEKWQQQQQHNKRTSSPC
ncbi:putative transcription factor [Iris pallida]|uniref:Transcription factor n=1 Tax=Iris pallida TaxID=29817 RepID=A0AAX6G4E9_IRIPA|nr:putative transcription factor [Iris pallida]